eukprot:GHVP01018211.1.p1 GENE.GHVP01018211.1~~GHVP01018211.1.p1  ORF type:complete len:147 (-),score=4.73 GHVP01018211.1:537-977(-)
MGVMRTFVAPTPSSNGHISSSNTPSAHSYPPDTAHCLPLHPHLQFHNTPSLRRNSCKIDFRFRPVLSWISRIHCLQLEFKKSPAVNCAKNYGTKNRSKKGTPRFALDTWVTYPLYPAKSALVQHHSKVHKYALPWALPGRIISISD